MCQSLQSYLTLCNLMDCSLPDSPVHGQKLPLLLARMLEKTKNRKNSNILFCINFTELNKLKCGNSLVAQWPKLYGLNTECYKILIIYHRCDEYFSFSFQLHFKTSFPSSRGCTLSYSLTSSYWREVWDSSPQCCFCYSYDIFYFEVYLQNTLLNRVHSHMPSSLHLCIFTKCLHFFEDLSTPSPHLL